MLAQTVAIELSSPEDLQSPMMGFPKIHVLSTALLKLRWWANQQPKRLARDVSETTYRLQVKLENCRNALEKLNDSIIFLE